jgi:hypothetical protein
MSYNSNECRDNNFALNARKGEGKNGRKQKDSSFGRGWRQVN